MRNAETNRLYDEWVDLNLLYESYSISQATHNQNLIDILRVLQMELGEHIFDLACQK